MRINILCPHLLFCLVASANRRPQETTKNHRRWISRGSTARIQSYARLGEDYFSIFDTDLGLWIVVVVVQFE